MTSNFLLFPYYLVLKSRNAFYNKRLSKSYAPKVKTIGVGNINVGGTGKTPLTDYIVSVLKEDRKVTILSRGYKSSNKKYREVQFEDNAKAVGDEPLLLKQRHPDITVAIDKNKTRAIKHFESLPDENIPDVVVIDDCLQHRKVRPGKMIVTIDYSKPIFNDNLLPIGSLRDLPERIGAADVIIITKCPAYLDEWEKEKILTANRIGKNIPVYFTSYQYENPLPVFKNEGDGRYVYSKEALLITGIAKSKPLIMQLADKYDKVFHIKYSDHHNFSSKDIRKIKRFAGRNTRAALLTTEKDAQRLRTSKAMIRQRVLHSRLFYVPISIKFLSEKEEAEFKEFLRK